MAGDVVALFGQKIPQEEVDQDIVERLEKLLVKARAGEIMAIGYACVDKQESLTTAWSGSAGSRYILGCAAGLLHQRYLEALIEDSKKIT